MNPLILAINAGSSSIKLAVIDGAGARLLDMKVTGLSDSPRLHINAVQSALDCTSVEVAFMRLYNELAKYPRLTRALVAVGHRVAHGGADFPTSVRIDDEVLATIQSLSTLAPLHNGSALTGILQARRHFPGLAHVAVFDTAFHSTLPRRAREYALPAKLREQFSIRRFGFHGISHAWVSQVAAKFLGIPLSQLRLVSCHLGSGASVCAVEYGRSIDTSMGMTPLEGLIMSTRSGDLDPGILTLLAASGYDAASLDHLLNYEAGLKGLTGTADMARIESRAAAGEAAAQLALQLFAYRVRKYVGAYATALGGMDVLIFTAGIGEHSAGVRHRIAQRLEFLGASLDEDRNRQAAVDHEHPVFEISANGARCRILVVATDEERALAGDVHRLLKPVQAHRTLPKIAVAVSAHHVHLSQASLEILFGPGHQLTQLRPISQPGQYAAAECVRVVGPRGHLDHVRVLGPVRQADQVEISRSDEFILGIDAPVRESGDLAQSAGCRLEGPAGAIELTQGVICALRHIHMSPDDARLYGVKDGESVEVKIIGGARPLTFSEVKIRVSTQFVMEMHIDTDEANAAGIGDWGESPLVSLKCTAQLSRRLGSKT